MTINIIDLMKGFFELIGIAIYAHYLAYAVSFGWAKGQAKVKRVNNINLEEITIKHS